MLALGKEVKDSFSVAEPVATDDIREVEESETDKTSKTVVMYAMGSEKVKNLMATCIICSIERTMWKVKRDEMK